MTRMKSLGIAAVTAFGIALTPMPAAADTSDVAKVLGGLAVLGIIAKTVDDRRDRKKAAAAAQRRNAWRTIENSGRDGAFRGELRRIDDKRKTKVNKAKKRALPDRCARIAETGRRDRLVYLNRCLKRNYKHANRLPEFCKREIRTSRGLRTVYGAGCLRRDGWKVARR